MAWLSVYRTSTLPHQGRQALGPNLNRSESGRSAGQFASCAAACNDNTQGPPEAAALRDFDPTYDRSGSFASILPCPPGRPLFTTADITTPDREPSACRSPASDLQTTARPPQLLRLGL